ncbi:sulfotransferase domain-containing protein [Labilibaculum euxinus]
MKGKNIIHASAIKRVFSQPGIKFSVSGRFLIPNIDILDYLKLVYIYISPDQVESIYGSSVTPSPLYGGRAYKAKHSFTEDHVEQMENNGISLSLNLTNHLFSEEVYTQSLGLLKKHHKKGNSIICTSDELAIRIRRDFPEYILKASIIKNLNEEEKVRKAFKIYDQVVIPMDKNDDDDFLISLPEKHRIILFANANCAYTCPQRICYGSIAGINQNNDVKFHCSKSQIPRQDFGNVYFDLEKFVDMGFSSFKLVPTVQKKVVGFLETLKNKSIDERDARVSFLVSSFPKCGRTWLRFIIANYLNLEFGLNIQQLNLHNIFSILPNEGKDNLKGIGTFKYGDNKEIPLISFSHKKPSDCMKGEKRLLIIRSIPDVMVSYFFHTKELLGLHQDDISSFIRKHDGGVEKYCQFLNLWALEMKNSNFLVLTYEMLHDETFNIVKSALEFFDMTVDSGKLAKAIDLSSFDNMQKVEIDKGIAGHTYKADQPEARRVRKGIVGGYLDYLDSDDIAYIRNRTEELLSEASKKMLGLYGLYPLI